MTKTLLHFLILLSFSMGVGFLIHTKVQDLMHVGSFEHHLVVNYIFNFLITCVITIMLIVFQHKKSNKLGFVFLYSSIFKFLLFFIIIKPNLILTEGIKGIEFANFFIPYGICAAIETIYLVRLLGKND